MNDPASGIDRCEEIIVLMDKRSRSHTIDHIQKPLDVIIPVYNAYEDLLDCLKSVLIHQSGYRILLIDDKSTDYRVVDLMQNIKNKASTDLVVIENEANSGFVKTVNKGMKLSGADVILLNSDTIVTKGWARKLQKCAYSSEKFATVTPLTNYSSICSVPNFYEYNEIPEGFTLDSFSQFIEEISLRQYPEIPTAVGFCMYIKRKVLAEIGYFDEDAFGRGYGEENDFCMRALKKGYTNVLCDDTYILHTGGKSFLQEKSKLRDEHIQILTGKHPEYSVLTGIFFRDNPLKPLQDNIKLKMRTWLTYGDIKCDYYDIIKNINLLLKPKTYVEIGVRYGDRFYLPSANTLSIGIDPNIDMKPIINENSKLFNLTSDEFFNQYDLKNILNDQTIDLALIDGLHLFENTLQDFMNIEKYCCKNSFILIHDSIPIDRLTSERDRKTKVWTGDVWKIIPCLKKYRPDLQIYNLNITPSGIAIITNLNPRSNVLKKKMAKLHKEYIPLEFTDFERNIKNMDIRKVWNLESIFMTKNNHAESYVTYLINKIHSSLIH